MTDSRSILPGRYRTVWISDVHLGTKDCRADFLLDFLRSTDCEQLYLVGDIVDLWGMRRAVHWSDVHNSVVRTVLKKAQQGTKVTYIPGNHDEFLRDYVDTAFGSVTLRKEAVHETADGRRFLVLHGDEFDGAVPCTAMASLVGTALYDLVLAANRWLAIARRTLGFPYWSLAAFLKKRFRNASAYIDRFDRAVAREASERGMDGLICGHIHRAEMRQLEGVLYANTGDWVESCTALVEHPDGSLELVHWSDRRHSVHYIAGEGPAPAMRWAGRAA